MNTARLALLQGQDIIRRSLYEWNILPWLLQKSDQGPDYYNFSTRHLTFGVVGLNECLVNLTGDPLVNQTELGKRSLVIWLRELINTVKRTK